MQKIKLLFLFILLSSIQISAQDIPEDENNTKSDIFLKNILHSIKFKEYLDKDIRNKFPRTRFLDIQYQYSSPTDFSTKLGDQDYIKGRANTNNTLMASLNVPLLNTRRWTIIASGRYNYSSISLKNIYDQSSNTSSSIGNKTKEADLFNTGISTTYLTPLFNKLFVANLYLSGEGSHKGYQRFKGIVFASLLLKQSRKTQMSIGLIGLLDNKSAVPVVPSFSYQTTLSRGWILDIFLPQYVSVRRPILKSSRLTLGSEIGGFAMYYEGENKKMYYYKQNQVKTGFKYEHQLSEKILVSMNGGIMNTFGGQLINAKQSQRHYILTSKQDMNAYFNVQVSYNFFSKIIR